MRQASRRTISLESSNFKDQIALFTKLGHFHYQSTEERSGAKTNIVPPTNPTRVSNWAGHKVPKFDNMSNHRWMLQEGDIQEKLGTKLSQ